MVLEIIMENLAEYVFGSRLLLGIAILSTMMMGAAMFRIDKSSMLLIVAPIMLIAVKTGHLPPGIGVLAFIGILILWGIMFMLMLGKK